jgi:1,4-alpha-glucan branching enzyme
MRKVYLEKDSACSLFKTNEAEYAGIPAGKLKLRFTTNHDEAAKHSPIVEWINQRGSMSAYATILFFPGCPMIYGSQEVGHPAAINFFNHIQIDWKANTKLWKEYQQLLSIYNSNEGLRKGDLKAHFDSNILLFERFTAAEKYVLAINVRDSVISIAVPEELRNQSFINLCNGQNQTLNDSLILQAFEYLILK